MKWDEFDKKQLIEWNDAKQEKAKVRWCLLVDDRWYSHLYLRHLFELASGEHYAGGGLV